MAAELRDLRARAGAQTGPASRGPDPRMFEKALQEMAAELRDLRMRAGAPSLRQLSTQIRDNDTLPATVSMSALSEVFSGRRLPRWDSLSAIVRTLNGDEREWRVRWMRLEELQAAQRGPRKL
ncbi:helix-turn-helix domain-containing protein [Streptomyces olivaceus]|uniref:helix-turn-helix domain-containing protein n=2 Tax=Streptomyces olivaceus TaxID=47716 RepID=UPI0036C36BCB